MRDAAEFVLQDGETLSSFVEQSVRAQVQLRQHHDAFVARGLAAPDNAHGSHRYVSADDVLAGLQTRLAAARKA